MRSRHCPVVIAVALLLLVLPWGIDAKGALRSSVMAFNAAAASSDPFLPGSYFGGVCEKKAEPYFKSYGLGRCVMPGYNSFPLTVEGKEECDDRSLWSTACYDAAFAASHPSQTKMYRGYCIPEFKNTCSDDVLRAGGLVTVDGMCMTNGNALGDNSLLGGFLYGSRCVTDAEYRIRRSTIKKSFPFSASYDFTGLTGPPSQPLSPDAFYMWEKCEPALKDKCSADQLSKGYCASRTSAVGCGPGFFFCIGQNHGWSQRCESCPAGQFRDVVGDGSCKPLTVGKCPPVRVEIGGPQWYKPLNLFYIDHCRDTICGGWDKKINSNTRICRPFTKCTSDEFESVAPTATSDRVCKALTVCKSTEYELVPARTTRDRMCQPLTTCKSSEFEYAAPTATSDRVCKAYTGFCNPNFSAWCSQDQLAKGYCVRNKPPLATCCSGPDCCNGISLYHGVCNTIPHDPPAGSSYPGGCYLGYEGKCGTFLKDGYCVDRNGKCGKGPEFCNTKSTYALECQGVATLPTTAAPTTPPADKVYTKCAASEFEVAAPSATTDRRCAPLATCDPGAEFESKAPTATSDRVCKALAKCTSDEYQSVAPTATSDRACLPLTVCTSDQYESIAKTTTSDRVCTPYTMCTSDQYETVAKTTTSDRVCTPYTVCTSDQYETLPKTATSDRVCKALTVCTKDQYETVAKTATSDRVCKALTVCASDQYISIIETASSDRVCKALTVCASGQYDAAISTKTNDRVCTPWTVCSDMQFEAVAPTATRNRKCATSQLLPGERLPVGKCMRSPNGSRKMCMQTDGNLVTYNPDGGVYYASNTGGRNDVARLDFQSDGNLCINRANGSPIKCFGTDGCAGRQLHLDFQDDSNTVIYAEQHGKRVAWSTDGRWGDGNRRNNCGY